MEAEVQPGTEGSGGTGANPSGGLPEPRGPIASTLAELRRVVWPSRQQLISESVAVLLMVLALNTKSLALLAKVGLA